MSEQAATAGPILWAFLEFQPVADKASPEYCLQAFEAFENNRTFVSAVYPEHKKDVGMGAENLGNETRYSEIMANLLRGLIKKSARPARKDPQLEALRRRYQGGYQPHQRLKTGHVWFAVIPVWNKQRLEAPRRHKVVLKEIEKGDVRFYPGIRESMNEEDVEIVVIVPRLVDGDDVTKMRHWTWHIKNREREEFDHAVDQRVRQILATTDNSGDASREENSDGTTEENGYLSHEKANARHSSHFQDLGSVRYR